jgi:hypothetical protein
MFAELGARSNFSLLDGASHPEELVEAAAALGLAGLAVCDINSLAGVVRAHTDAKRVGLPFAVGARLVLDDGAGYLVWPADRAAYGRLTRLLSLGRTRVPKGEGCRIARADLLAHAEGWAVALVPPEHLSDGALPRGCAPTRPPCAAGWRCPCSARPRASSATATSAASTPSPRWPPRRARPGCWRPPTRATTTPRAAASPTC